MGKFSFIKLHDTKRSRLLSFLQVCYSLLFFYISTFRLISLLRERAVAALRISAFDLKKLGVAPWQIRAIIRRGFMADTSRNNKEYPVSLPFLSNKSRRARTAAFTQVPPLST